MELYLIAIIGAVAGTISGLTYYFIARYVRKIPCPICKYRKTTHRISNRYYCSRCETVFFRGEPDD